MDSLHAFSPVSLEMFVNIQLDAFFKTQGNQQYFDMSTSLGGF